MCQRTANERKALRCLYLLAPVRCGLAQWPYSSIKNLKDKIDQGWDGIGIDRFFGYGIGAIQKFLRGSGCEVR